MKTTLALLFLAAAASGATPTFNRDIAPILYEQCAGCHRPGEVAPFALLTYQDAAKRASLIATVTGSRYMPPWKAEPGYGHFQDERRLSDKQIELIRNWAKNGAPEGDAADKPAPPKFASGWLAGKPDTVLSMSQPFDVPGDGEDVFQCFVLPLEGDAAQAVKTVEFHPGNPRVVHHALFYLDASGEARRLAAASPRNSYPCFGGPRVVPSGSLGGWAPGATPEPLPEGTAYPVPKGANIVLQIHYHPSGKPETDRSSLGLTFAGESERSLTNFILGSTRIELPAGDARYEIADTRILLHDAELVGIIPHAHLLCKEMKVEAQLPDGKIEPLIWIKDWDFNWQGQYRYAEPMLLPKGTRLSMRYVYDNSENNPHNPSKPPKTVHYGEQTSNEMAYAFLQFAVPVDEVKSFRRAVALSRLDRMIDDNDFSSLGEKTAADMRRAVTAFDANHNGVLEPDEREKLMQFIAGFIK